MRTLILLLTFVSSLTLQQPNNTGVDAGAHSSQQQDTTTPLPPTPSDDDFQVEEGPVAGKGEKFTKKQKIILKERNATANEGKVVCESCDIETVPAKKHEKDVSPPLNEAHTDHVIPRSKGGKAELDNGQILCRDCNIKKSDKTE